MSDRQSMILRELKQYDEMKSDATYPIDFRGERKYLPLIRVPQELLILNHKNNRLSGQLLDHPQKDQIEANPELVDLEGYNKSSVPKHPKIHMMRYRNEKVRQSISRTGAETV